MLKVRDGFNAGKWSGVASAVFYRLEGLLNGEPQRIPLGAVSGVERLLGLAHHHFVRDFGFPAIEGISHNLFPQEFSSYFSQANHLVLDCYYSSIAETREKDIFDNVGVVRDLIYWNNSLRTLVQVPSVLKFQYEDLKNFYRILEQTCELESFRQVHADEDDD